MRYGAAGPIRPASVAASWRRRSSGKQHDQPRQSLEAVAALLGHRTIRLTLVYALISDRTVIDGYFRLTEAVEANYQNAWLMPSSCSCWPSHARMAVY